MVWLYRRQEFRREQCRRKKDGALLALMVDRLMIEIGSRRFGLHRETFSSMTS